MNKKNDLLNRISELNIPPLNEKQGTVLLSMATEILFGGAAGPGKALDVNTPVLTSDGFKKFIDLKIGDLVYTDKGILTPIIAKTEVMYNRDCYEFLFDDGEKIIADAKHLWKTFSNKEREQTYRLTDTFRKNRNKTRPKRGAGKKEWLSELNSKRQYVYKSPPEGTIRNSEELYKTQKISGRTNYSIKVNELLENNDIIEYTIDPYVLGAWLGDGQTAFGAISSGDIEIINQISSCGYKITDRKSKYDYGILGLMSQLRSLNLLGNKHIPDDYLFGSYEQRLSLVQGLMDTDGSIDKRGKQCFFYNTNKDIIDKMSVLLWSLGIKNNISSKIGKLYGIEKKKAYTICFTTDKKVFRLERKAKYLPTKLRSTQKWRYIKQIKKVKSVPVQCIKVADPSGMFLAGKSLVPTHNSHALRVLSIFWAVLVPGINIYLFRRQSDDLTKNHLEGAYGYPVLLQKWVDDGICQIIHSSPKEIRFNNGSKIFLCHVQLEKHKYKYQGSEIHVLLIDELTHFTKSIYTFLRGRVRLGGLKIDKEKLKNTFNELIKKYLGLDIEISDREADKYFPRILCGTNPGNIGHAWVKQSFIDMQPPMQITKMDKKNGGMYRQFIPARLIDNPVLLEIDPDYAERLHGLDNPALASAMIDGDWDIVAGGAIDDVWDRDIHVLKPFEIPKSWDIYRGFDWGSSKPFSVCWFAESNGEFCIVDNKERYFPPGTTFMINELYGWNGQANEGCRWSNRRIGATIAEIENGTYYNDRIMPGPADSCIFDDTGGKEEAESIHDNMLIGFNENSYEYTDELFTKADKRPGSRIKGLSLLRDYLAASMKKPMENKGFFVFDNCTQFIRTVPVLPRSEKNMEDVDTEAEDHIYDVVRYALYTERPNKYERLDNVW